MKSEAKKLFTISNLLSFIRIFLAIPIYYFLASGQNAAALIVIGIAFISDFLDGYFARRFDQVTEAGKILDPFADKVCTTAGFIALYIYQNFQLWLVLVIISRDLIIMLASLYYMGRKRLVLPSNRIGKITVFLISLLAILYIFKLYFITRVLNYLVLVFILLSIFNYAKIYLKELKGDHA